MPSVLWSLALAATVALASPTQWDYIVNDLFDDSLARMEASMHDTGGSVPLESVTVGGYFLEGAEISDLTMLRRHGNVTISSTGSLVKVSGFVELPNMVVSGGNITSLDATILNPTVTFNGFDGFSFDFWSDIKSKGCKNGYPLERKYWTRGSVILTSDTEEYDHVDITKFIQLYEHDISEPIQNALSEAFSNYFGLCETIRKLQSI